MAVRIKRCNFMGRRLTLAQREHDCPLDHCTNQHHVDPGEPCTFCLAEGNCECCGQQLHHGASCKEASPDHDLSLQEEVERAEILAGWDAGP